MVLVSLSHEQYNRYLFTSQDNDVVKIQSFGGVTGVTTPGLCPGWWYMKFGVFPRHMTPLPLGCTNKIQKNTGHYTWSRFGCQCWQTSTSWGPTLYFLFGFTSVAFFLCLDMAARQLRFKIRVFLPLVGLPSWADKLHLPEVAGYEARVVHLSILLRLGAGLCSKPEKYSVPNENIFAFLAFVGLLLWVCCLKILLLKR